MFTVIPGATWVVQAVRIPGGRGCCPGGGGIWISQEHIRQAPTRLSLGW